MDKRYSFAIPIIVGCAQFMHQFDGSVIATALPAMARTLHDNPLRLNLAISCYLLALAVFVPISGWLSDRFGARRIFMTAIAIFTTSSMLCGLSHSLWQLVIARTVQGLGGAMMTPVGRVIVAKTAPRSELVKAMNYITIPGVLAPVLGPSVGGFIVSYFSWPWIFFVNLPIGVMGLFLVAAHVPDLPREETPPLDAAGFLMTALALASLVFGFESLGRGLLPTWSVVALLAGGSASGVLYWFHARRLEIPIIDLKLMRFKTFAASITGGSLFYMTTSAIVFLLAMLFQIDFGLSAFAAGLVLLGVASGSAFSRFAFRPALRYLGFRRMLIANSLITGAYLFVVSFFRPSLSYGLILPVLFIGGLSRSMQYSSIQSLSYAEMPKPLMSRATSFSAMMQQFCQSFGVGLTALVVHFALTLHGHEKVQFDDLQYGFWTIGLCSFLSLITFVRLPRTASAALEEKDMRRRGAKQE